MGQGPFFNKPPQPPQGGQPQPPVKRNALQQAIGGALDSGMGALRGFLGDAGPDSPISGKLGAMAGAALPLFGPLRNAELLQRMGGGRDRAVTEAVMQALQRGEGATINAQNARNMAGSGRYAVAMFPEATQENIPRVTRDVVEEFIRKNKGLLDQPGTNVGVWAPRGKPATLDVSAALENRQEAENIGNLLGEKALGWLKEPYEDIPLQNHGLRPSGLPPVDVRLEELLKFIRK